MDTGPASDSHLQIVICTTYNIPIFTGINGKKAKQLMLRVLKLTSTLSRGLSRDKKQEKASR